MIEITGTGIRAIGYHVAAPVETCDRCGAGIKYVTTVRYADGSVGRYGSECINKVLDSDNSLKKLFAKNQKLLAQFTHWLEVLNRPILPKGHEYYNAGLWFIVDDSGNTIKQNNHGTMIFHPEVDEVRNACSNYPFNGRDRWTGKGWVQNTIEEHRRRCAADVEKAKAWLTSEIERLSAFLSSTLSKAARVQARQIYAKEVWSIRPVRGQFHVIPESLKGVEDIKTPLGIYGSEAFAQNICNEHNKNLCPQQS